jgi:hypothetical protein
VLALHRRWHGLRASLRALVAEDAEARSFYRRQRRRQLDLLADLGGAVATRTDDAVLLYTLERVCDAIADGELRELGLAVEPAVALLRRRVLERIRLAAAAPRRSAARGARSPRSAAGRPKLRR